jgi:hypothetical protein
VFDTDRFVPQDDVQKKEALLHDKRIMEQNAKLGAYLRAMGNRPAVNPLVDPNTGRYIGPRPPLS